MFDIQIDSKFGEVVFSPMTLRDVIFTTLPHRNEASEVIYSHIGEQPVTITLALLRKITFAISEKLVSYGLKTGDTIMLASFSCSNELANALIFTSAACLGIRVFVPIFPEPAELKKWKDQTGFSCLIMPYREILALKGYEREKEVVHTLQSQCTENNIQFIDSHCDLLVHDIIKHAYTDGFQPDETLISGADIFPETEAVVFTTSGTSGISKLVTYTNECFGNCCQAWQRCGLFTPELFGNPGFSPLFTHTIGIRTFINSIWSGNPSCIIVTDWFLHKPEVVRYLLLNMGLGHLIAGPAFYNTMLELFRQYPELKTGINNSLRSAISIGAPFDETTALKFRSATGVLMMNGFGTTETLMVTLNMPDDSGQYSGWHLGTLLPGASFRLKKYEEESIFELSIHSAFQAVRTIGEAQTGDYFETGDLVKYIEKTGEIFFQGRKSNDFLKDEYGVKIPLNALRNYYNNLYSIASWIEWIPLVNIPGLAALIFLPKDNKGNQLKELNSLIKSTNEELKDTIEPFEYSHRHLERFTLIHEEVPLTRKGTVSRYQIYRKYEQVVSDIRNPFVFSQSIETPETGDKSSLYKYSDPHMAELLEALKLDKVYVKGEGDYLFYRDGETLQRVTDFVGGFGSNLFGHNNARIREAVIHFLESGYPALNNQGSQYYYSPLLARELNRVFGKSTGRYFKVLYGNSGTEATEIAMHHAYFEWRMKLEKIRDEQLQLYGAIPELKAAEVWDRNMILIEEAVPCFITINNCFHGYTSGARSLLNRKKKRYLFSGLLNPHPLTVSDSEENWKEQLFQFFKDNNIELRIFKMQDGKYVNESVKYSNIIASIIEPVRGEGGIYEINSSLVEFLSEQEFPLISDEIQCGLGRTGSLPSCRKASYYLLGKSLGGGIEKISAVIIDDQRFKPEFSKYFTSTFANGELAAYMGLTSLCIINEENLTEVAKEKGTRYLSILHKIAAEFPDVIESVSGSGLMIGIHFNPKIGADNNFLRILIENEVSGYLFAGWFLNKLHIRVLPSLSKPNSIRVEPSVYLKDKNIYELASALEELCQLCKQKKIYEICKFLMNDDPYPDKANPVFNGLFPQQIEPPAPGSIEAGFIGNFTLPHRELQVIEPDFLKASDTGLRILFNRLQILLEGKPVKILSKNLLNNRVHFTFYILPFDTSQMEIVSRWGKKRFYISKIQDAVNTITKEGAACLSLGAHTSIISGNGLSIAERNQCNVLTGNTLTVASCLYYLRDYLETFRGFHGEPLTISIVGASGNIGSGFVDCIDDQFQDFNKVILVGNNEKRLLRLKEKMCTQKCQVECTTDLFELKNSDIIICCVNTNDPVIFPYHIRNEKPVFIIDISVPGTVSQEVKGLKNVIFCKEASSVFLPENPDILMSSHTPAGKIFCCAAESILYALYGLNLSMKGHINKEAVKKLLPLAIKEGFFKQQQYEFPI